MASEPISTETPVSDGAPEETVERYGPVKPAKYIAPNSTDGELKISTNAVSIASWVFMIQVHFLCRSNSIGRAVLDVETSDKLTVLGTEP
jgi:hypothetical protein